MKRKTEHAFIFMTALVMLILLLGFLWLRGEPDQKSHESALDERIAPANTAALVKISALKTGKPPRRPWS